MPRTSSVPDQPHTDVGVTMWTLELEQIKLRSGRQIIHMSLLTEEGAATKVWDVTPGKPLGNTVEDIMIRVRRLLFDQVWVESQPRSES